MLDSFNYKTKYFLSTNQDFLDYFDSAKKELAAYPEQNTLHFNNIANITIHSDSITPQNKQNEREEDHQEHGQIPL